MDEMVRALSAYSTPTISDSMDRLGLEGTCLGIRPLRLDFHLCGRAFTIQYGPVGSENGTVGDYIDDVAPGDVVVLDNRGHTDCTVWGDILTIVASQRELGGTVIDGVCRDSPRSFELNYPIFSRGAYMRTGKDRVQVDGVNIPVSIGGARVRPGDVLIGDSDGVVVVPAEHEQAVLQLAREIEEAEEEIRSAVRTGSRLDDARKQFNYHKLQSKQREGAK
ncbi:RraA family protein [Alicyclobacillus sp. ALC3]|uniref:RraA family protein n=1 Tax=Alicyclobacillus sp. ALC3 TaxID=2796143 RepID=UPI002377FB7B|nr:RraA family protein [Alicyclobacillus sp. ALC3]WDL97743.1 RraA family protein [Alicyclobacillus sp. ALC3]